MVQSDLLASYVMAIIPQPLRTGNPNKDHFWNWAREALLRLEPRHGPGVLTDSTTRGTLIRLNTGIQFNQQLPKRITEPKPPQFPDGKGAWFGYYTTDVLASGGGYKLFFVNIASIYLSNGQYFGRYSGSSVPAGIPPASFGPNESFYYRTEQDNGPFDPIISQGSGAVLALTYSIPISNFYPPTPPETDLKLGGWPYKNSYYYYNVFLTDADGNAL